MPCAISLRQSSTLPCVRSSSPVLPNAAEPTVSLDSVKLTYAPMACWTFEPVEGKGQRVHSLEVYL